MHTPSSSFCLYLFYNSRSMPEPLLREKFSANTGINVPVLASFQKISSKCRIFCKRKPLKYTTKHTSWLIFCRPLKFSISATKLTLLDWIHLVDETVFIRNYWAVSLLTCQETVAQDGIRCQRCRCCTSMKRASQALSFGIQWHKLSCWMWKICEHFYQAVSLLTGWLCCLKLTWISIK